MVIVLNGLVGWLYGVVGVGNLVCIFGSGMYCFVNRIDVGVIDVCVIGNDRSVM